MNGRAQTWESFEFLPRSLEALRLLAAHDYTAIVISRQGCNEEGTQDAKELDALTRRLLLEVAISQGHIAQVYYCRHRNEDDCNCYGQSAGLITRAKADHGFLAEETYFIGETQYALEAASAAGCPCFRIRRGAFLENADPDTEPYKVASSLYEATEQIVEEGHVRRLEQAVLHSY
jgi:D-glycero-D-manno-heptose 1,7-bisphosphate phosphatase